LNESINSIKDSEVS